ncbi:hypothetical protein [Acinetobacter guillouiae]|uniref:hypothetical protein n=1 Tax=Acinetobacter guillouiae TaxID=106649 RepID=UPI0028EE8C34|nr:hypothetical protein [Acinetobacter guillouiae]
MATMPTTIVVSGEMVRDIFHTAPGAIRIYRKDDRSGSIARWGRHTNYGYSGYYLASIYDGQKWRKLQFNRLISYESRSYDVARECSSVEWYLGKQIALWRGLVAQYDSNTRSFRIYSHEIIL